MSSAELDRLRWQVVGELSEWATVWDAAMTVRSLAEFTDTIGELQRRLPVSAARERAAFATFGARSDQLNALLAVAGWPGEGQQTNPVIDQANAELRRLADQDESLDPASAAAALGVGAAAVHVGMAQSMNAAKLLMRGRPTLLERKLAFDARQIAQVFRHLEAAGTSLSASSPSQLSTALLRFDAAAQRALTSRPSLATVQQIAACYSLLYAAAARIAARRPEAKSPDQQWAIAGLRWGHAQWEAAAHDLGEFRYRDEEPVDPAITHAGHQMAAVIGPLLQGGPSPVPADQALATLQHAVTLAPAVAEQARNAITATAHTWTGPAWAVHEASQLAQLERPTEFSAERVWVPVERVHSTGPIRLTAAAQGHLAYVWDDTVDVAHRVADRSMNLLPLNAGADLLPPLRPVRPTQEMPELAAGVEHRLAVDL